MIAMPAAMAARVFVNCWHAVERQRAVLRLVDTRQHLEQRRLARAVLAHQAVHLAAADVERDVVECQYAGKAHGDAVKLQIGACGSVGRAALIK